jgi:Protein of unknown function (DUF433)
MRVSIDSPRSFLVRISGTTSAMESTTTKTDVEGTEAITGPDPDRVRIASTPGTCGGKPRIDCHRITVKHIVLDH